MPCCKVSSSRKYENWFLWFLHKITSFPARWHGMGPPPLTDFLAELFVELNHVVAAVISVSARQFSLRQDHIGWLLTRWQFWLLSAVILMNRAWILWLGEGEDGGGWPNEAATIWGCGAENIIFMRPSFQCSGTKVDASRYKVVMIFNNLDFVSNFKTLETKKMQDFQTLKR